LYTLVMLITDGAAPVNADESFGFDAKGM
jgi:hypothetical protein